MVTFIQSTLHTFMVYIFFSAFLKYVSLLVSLKEWGMKTNQPVSLILILFCATCDTNLQNIWKNNCIIFVLINTAVPMVCRLHSTSQMGLITYVYRTLGKLSLLEF
jgi:hypothetical protein